MESLMVANLRPDVDLPTFLEERARGPEGPKFTIAWPRTAWQGAEAHLALLMEADTVSWLGRAVGGRPITTVERIVTVSEIVEIEPIPLERIRQTLPARHMTVVDREGILPPKGGQAVVQAIRELAPHLEATLVRLSSDRRRRLPPGRRGQLLSQERDAVGIALELAGVGRTPLASWTEGAVNAPFLRGIGLSTVGVPFLQGLDATAHEDSLIDYDAGRFSSWIDLPEAEVAWRIFTDGRNRVFVMNANRTAVERTLGVDLVYYNEARRSFVLVQYKKMVRGRTSDGRPWYWPDRHLRSELSRMQRIDQFCEVHPADDFRLMKTPCWVKLCESGMHIKNSADLISGMYLAREHFASLLLPEAGRRRTRLGYENVSHHVTNSLFIDLVKGGWIGSSGTGTDEVARLIRESLAAGRAVVVGTTLPGDPVRPVSAHASHR